jgi:phospholipid transport system substrate-binding protein
MKPIKQILSAIIVMMAVSPVINAAPKGPTAFLQSLDKKMQPLVAKADQNHDKILKLINKMLDFDALCKASLGKHWESHTAAQQKDFSDTLKALIEQNVIKRLKSTGSNNISYDSEKIKGETATVVTTVKDGDGPRAAQIEIAYKMAKKGGTWIVVDMETDGISLVSNYRSQFNKMIKKDGWDAMISKMKDKLEK